MGATIRQMKARKARHERAGKLREQARELKAQARDLTRDAKLDERVADLVEQAQDLADRARASEGLKRAQVRGGELAALGGEMALKARDTARESWHDSGLNDRAADLAQRVKESEQYRTASHQGRDAADRALASIGDWLSHGPAAKKLGVRPANKRRSAGMWLLGVLGVAAGFAAGMVMGARKKATVDEFQSVVGRIGQDTPDIGAPAAQKPVADEVRTRLGQDPRTSELPKLNINVAEGTVFVRGAVPEGTDEEAIRAVVGTVPGVEDIDLQLSTRAAD